MMSFLLVFLVTLFSFEQVVQAVNCNCGWNFQNVCDTEQVCTSSNNISSIGDINCNSRFSCAIKDILKSDGNIKCRAEQACFGVKEFESAGKTLFLVLCRVRFRCDIEYTIILKLHVTIQKNL